MSMHAAPTGKSASSPARTPQRKTNKRSPTKLRGRLNTPLSSANEVLCQASGSSQRKASRRHHITWRNRLSITRNVRDNLLLPRQQKVVTGILCNVWVDLHLRRRATNRWL